MNDVYGQDAEEEEEEEEEDEDEDEDDAAALSIEATRRVATARIIWLAMLYLEDGAPPLM